MSQTLNLHMRASTVRTRPCHNFTATELQREVLRPMFDLASEELLALYQLTADPRARTMHSGEELEAAWEEVNEVVRQYPALHTVQRDGLCHEAVMWFVHHISQTDRASLEAVIQMPLLPDQQHSIPSDTNSSTHHDAHQRVYKDYKTKVSCQQCHSGPVSAKWKNATLGPPLPVDPAVPGRERLRSCDYLNQPTCGPCDGLGGPRTGDSSEQFTPMNCTVVAHPDEVPLADRPDAKYPEMGTANMAGDTRSPLAVYVDPTTPPGKYPTIDAQILLGWDSQMARHRYDFQGMPPFNGPMSQIYLQTRDSIQSGNNSGAMVTIVGREHKLSLCICMDGIAGNMHIDSFTPHSPDDPLRDLPADQGGLDYLGRVAVTLDAGSNRTVLADHYLKWAFHLLVDADKQSATYGLPLRLYGSTGVRMVYSNWSLQDPRAVTPDIFQIPKFCILRGETCKQMKAEQDLAALTVAGAVQPCDAQSAPYYDQTCAEAHGEGYCCDPARLDVEGQCGGYPKDKSCYYKCESKGWDAKSSKCTA